MSGMNTILARMSELGLLAKDVTKNTSDISLYQEEFQELQNQLRDTIGGDAATIGGTAVASPLGTFNGIELFGSSASGHVVTIGEASGQNMTVPDSNLRTDATLNIIHQNGSGVYDVSLTDSADSVIAAVSSAIQQIATERASLGASQSRLELAASTLDVEYENLSSAISRIKDVDVADESTQLARYNILVQSGTAMLSQANQMPSSVLKLLQ
jgi:flagellin